MKIFSTKPSRLINDFKEYFIRHNQVIYENPSPGNKKGGISTLEEKSLGCTQKGGTENVVDVLDYGERVTTAGLNLLKGPGNDIVACTAIDSGRGAYNFVHHGKRHAAWSSCSDYQDFYKYRTL